MDWTTVLALLVALCSGGITTDSSNSDAANVTPSPAPRQVKIATVLSDLRREAERGWRADQRFPRQQCNYAQEKKYAVDHGDLVRVLTRRLSSHPAIDAYMRWQLLSFNPDFTQASEDELHQLLNGLPPLRDASGRLVLPGLADPTLSVVNEGTVLDLTGTVGADPRYVTVTGRVSIADIGQIRRVPILLTPVVSRRIALASNEAVVRFRNAFIERLSLERGHQAVALLQDVMDRQAAGHPSARSRFGQFVRRLDDIKSRPPFSEEIRKHLQENLAELRTSVLESEQPQSVAERPLDPKDMDKAKQNLAHAAHETTETGKNTSPAAALRYERKHRGQMKGTVPNQYFPNAKPIPFKQTRNIKPVTQIMWSQKHVEADFVAHRDHLRNKNPKAAEHLKGVLVIVKTEMCHQRTRICATTTAALEKGSTDLLRHFRIYGAWIKANPDHRGPAWKAWEKRVIRAYDFKQGPSAKIVVFFPGRDKRYEIDAQKLKLYTGPFEQTHGKAPLLDKFLRDALEDVSHYERHEEENVAPSRQANPS